MVKFIGKEEPGEILDIKGNVIGEHKGHFTVTLGQRRGLGGVALGKPAYVVQKDHKKNTVTLGDRDHFSRKKINLTRVNWLADLNTLSGGLSARIRYRGSKRSIEQIKKHQIVFQDPVTVAPGQSIVVYLGTRVIGGGVAQ